MFQSMPETPNSLMASDGQTIPEEHELLLPEIPRSGHVHNGCQCRYNLMGHIPSLESVMQEISKPRIDKMFKITGEVISSCRSAIACTNCHIGPVDLVCILTVFQQTAYCLQQISQSGLNGDDFRVGVGDYQVLLNDDANIKSILVLNLVAQANLFLDAVTVHAQNLFLSPSSPDTRVMGRSPACLNQLNLDYLQQVTSNFKKLFRLITDVFEMKKANV